MKSSLLNEKGYTVIELLTGLMLSGLAGLSLTYILLTSMDIYDITMDNSSKGSGISNACNLVLRDIRQVDNTDGILEATGNRLQFVDINGKNIDIRYSSQNGRLWRTVTIGGTGTTDTLLFNPTLGFRLSYESRDELILQEPIEISQIAAVILCFSDTTATGIQQITAKTSLRNKR